MKVLDFGIAKLLTPLATDATLSTMETRGLIGTPLYMSPEQAYEKNVDARTDLWSQLRLDAPPLAGLIVSRALEKDLTNRYQSASESLLYRYPKTPLNVKLDGVIKETANWHEEKITFDDGYRGERMSAYVFLPKNVRPPFQTVLFFPSARVLFLPGQRRLPRAW